MNSNHRIWDRFAKRYYRQPIADPASYEIKLQITRDYLKPTMRVLEFGCGTGGTAIAHAPHVKEIDCIDISKNMIAIARQQAAEKKVGNVNFQVADFAAVDAPAQSYDAVLGLSILHLVDDRDAAIRKVHDLLKPGGVFISSTTCLGDKRAFFKWLGPIGARLGVLPTLRVFKKSELEESLICAGFKIVHQWQPDGSKAVFIIVEK